MRTFEFNATHNGDKILVLIQAEYHGQAVEILTKELNEKNLGVLLLDFDSDPDGGDLHDVTLTEPGILEFIWE